MILTSTPKENSLKRNKRVIYCILAQTHMLLYYLDSEKIECWMWDRTRVPFVFIPLLRPHCHRCHLLPVFKYRPYLLPSENCPHMSYLLVESYFCRQSTKRAISLILFSLEATMDSNIKQTIKNISYRNIRRRILAVRFYKCYFYLMVCKNDLWCL